MAETSPLTTKPLPFRDIKNQSFQGSRYEIEDNVSKEKQQKNRHQHDRSLSHKYSRQSETKGKNDSDFTVKKEKPLLHEELGSVKTINDQRYLVANEEIDHAEWELFKDKSSGEISRNLRLQCDFADLKNKFLQFARKSKMTMCQNTESFVTVRKGGAGSCRCIYQMWTNYEPQSTVYQLRKYSRSEPRAKMILVEGNKDIFHSFFIKCLKNFQSQKLVKVSPGQKVEIIFENQKKETNSCEETVSYILKRIAKGKRVNTIQIDTLVARLRNQSFRLKQTLGTIPYLNDVASLQQKIELMCYKTSGILTLFDQLYLKEFEDYRKKRQNLLKKYPISQLFRQLQISDHFSQFKRLRSLKEIQIQEKIPYLAAIRDLRLLSNRQSPSFALQIVILFHQRIRSCYSRYFKNCLKLGDMDDYLPVTIFCVLAVECDQNLLAVVKWLLYELNGAYEYQWEKKTLTDLEAAFEYILNQWQVA